MKIFASMRFIGPQYPMSRSPIAWAPNYWKNPEWTMRTKEGAPITNLSLAYPEVRKYWLSLLRETLDYGTDGIQFHLNRSEPYVFYEEPVVRSFQDKYGEDPRKIGGDNIHIWPDLIPRAQTAASYARLAKKYYEAGADGLCFWDGERRTARISEWAAAQRLGHVKQLNHLVEEGPSFYRAVDLKYLGGFDVKWSFKDG